jgi:CubicO group peptidase (beta-lactamase class C family)
MRLTVAAVTILLFASYAVADPLPRARPESVGMSSERLDRIGQALRADIDRGRLPGAVVAIARRGRLVYLEAFGYLDKSANVPMPRDAIFSIASMTKPMAAVAALMLHEEGRLLVTAPVGDYLPQLAKMQVAVLRKDGSGNVVMETVPARRAITSQDLMRHTAGLTYGNRGTTALHKTYPLSSNWSATNLTGAELLEKLSTLPVHYQPGSVWDYSLGLDVLGLAVEAVSGQTLGQFLDQRLFKPLEMTDTAFVVPREKSKRLAKPLPADPDTGKPQLMRDATKPTRFECGGGCAVSTASDYLRFSQMLLNRGRLGDVRILGGKTVDFMTANHLGPEVDVERLRTYPNINGYGFGLSVAVRQHAGMAGMMGTPGDYNWGGANGTYFWVDPKEQLAVVFMAHTPSPIRLHSRQLITALVLQSIVD